MSTFLRNFSEYFKRAIDNVPSLKRKINLTDLTSIVPGATDSLKVVSDAKKIRKYQIDSVINDTESLSEFLKSFTPEESASIIKEFGTIDNYIDNIKSSIVDPNNIDITVGESIDILNQRTSQELKRAVSSSSLQRSPTFSDNYDDYFEEVDGIRDKSKDGVNEANDDPNQGQYDKTALTDYEKKWFAENQKNLIEGKSTQEAKQSILERFFNSVRDFYKNYPKVKTMTLVIGGTSIVVGTAVGIAYSLIRSPDPDMEYDIISVKKFTNYKVQLTLGGNGFQTLCKGTLIRIRLDPEKIKPSIDGDYEAEKIEYIDSNNIIITPSVNLTTYPRANVYDYYGTAVNLGIVIGCDTGIPPLNQVPISYIEDEGIYSRNCELDNLTFDSSCTNNSREIRSTIKNFNIGSGADCVEMAKQKFGRFYDWKLDANNTKVYRKENCNEQPINCTLGSDLIIGSCKDNTRSYSLDITRQPKGTGEVCTSVASNLYTNYDWKLNEFNTQVYRSEKCRDCVLSDPTASTCTDNLITYSSTINQLPLDSGKNCIDVAKEKYGLSYEWKEDISKNKIYRTEACGIESVDCQLGNLVSDSCKNDTKKYYAEILRQPTGAGKVCSILAKEQYGTSYDWKLNTVNNKNYIYRMEDCLDCLISPILTSSTIPNSNNKREISANILRNPVGYGIECIDKAKSQHGIYDWQKDESNTKVYRFEDWNVTPVNCELNNVVTGTCVNNLREYSATVKVPQRGTGESCTSVATRLHNGSWSLSSDGSKVFRNEVCKDCELDSTITNSCTTANNIREYRVLIKEAPQGGGMSCINKAQLTYNNTGWSTRTIDNKNYVVRTEDCNIPAVNCELGSLVTGLCENSNIEYTALINKKSQGLGTPCAVKAKEQFGKDNWIVKTIDNKEYVYTTESCSSTPVGGVGQDKNENVITKAINYAKSKWYYFILIFIFIIIIFYINKK